MPKSKTRSKTSTTSSGSTTLRITTSLPNTTTSSNAASPTASERKGAHVGKVVGVVGVLGVMLAIAVLAVIGVVWRKQRQHKAVKARMLASSQTTFPQRAVGLEALRASPYLSLNQSRNEPSESLAQLVQSEDNGHGQATQYSESRQKSYHPTSGYSYPGERLW